MIRPLLFDIHLLLLYNVEFGCNCLQDIVFAKI